MKNKFVAVALVAILPISLIDPALAADATTSAAPTATTSNKAVVSANNQEPKEHITEAEKTEVANLLSSRGVDEKTQETLITKLESGNLLDADNPQVKPTNIERTEQDGKQVEKRVFPDGSVGVASSELSQATTELEAANISGCRSYDFGAWRRHDGCRIGYDGISFKFSFISDYSTTRSSGVKAVIRSAHSPIVNRAIGHSVNSNEVQMVRQWQVGDQPAHARQVVSMTPFKVLWTRSSTVELYVKDGTAWLGQR